MSVEAFGKGEKSNAREAPSQESPWGSHLLFRETKRGETPWSLAAMLILQLP